MTISAGGDSADVTVSPTLPLGTVLWSNRGDGSGVYNIVPAVPSSSGVADVFAFQNDGTVQAITSDGATAWSADVSQANSALPDFQGGLIVWGPNSGTNTSSIWKLDGITGMPYPVYTGPQWVGLSIGAVHPDGTVFAIQGSPGSTYSVVGVDPTTGTQKFNIPLDGGSDENNNLNTIIAGDGYAYVTWAYRGVDR